MAKKEPKQAHTVRAIAIARIYCACGWAWMPERVNGIADSVLAEQIENAFLEHQMMMRELDK